MTLAADRLQLDDPSLLAEAALIGGRWIAAADASGTIDVLDPATGALVGRVPDCGAADTRAAIEAGESLFDHLNYDEHVAALRAGQPSKLAFS